MNDRHSLKTENASVRLWLRILSCTKLIENDIRKHLRESFGTTLPRFDLMAQLYRYPEGLRMSKISELLMVTNGNITGIIDQLEAERLVERLPAAEDRRVISARLTPDGITRFEAMALEHRQWIDDLFGGLSDQEQQTLDDLLIRLRNLLQDKLS